MKLNSATLTLFWAHFKLWVVSTTDEYQSFLALPQPKLVLKLPLDAFKYRATFDPSDDLSRACSRIHSSWPRNTTQWSNCWRTKRLAKVRNNNSWRSLLCTSQHIAVRVEEDEFLHSSAREGRGKQTRLPPNSDLGIKVFPWLVEMKRSFK